MLTIQSEKSTFMSLNKYLSIIENTLEVIMIKYRYLWLRVLRAQFPQTKGSSIFNEHMMQ